MKPFDFDVFDLTGASKGGELSTLDSELQFDSAEYSSLDQLALAIDQLTNKRGKLRQKKFVSTKQLSVNGRVRVEPMEDYLATSAISSSLIREAMISPRHYFVSRNTPINKPKKCFEIGTFAHSAVLEPGKFEKVKIRPLAGRGSIAGCVELIKFYSQLLDRASTDNALSHPQLKELVKDLEAECDALGFSFIDESDFQIVNIMRQAVTTYTGGVIPKLMKYARKEYSMYGIDPQTGLDVKIRPDAMIFEEDFGINAILSVKTTRVESYGDFLRECANRRYEVSEGMYLDVASNVTGRQFSATITIGIQNTAPYQLFAHWWDAEDLQIGKYKYYNTMQTIRECEESGVYPGFEALAEEGHHGIIKGRLPSWIKAELPPQYVEG